MQAFEELPDDELMLMLQADDHGAFTALYHRYKGVLVIHANKKLANLEESKEIVQEVFSNLWYDRHKLPKIHNLKAFLYTLARNKVLNQIQHERVVIRYAESFTTFVQEHQNTTDLLIREKQMVEIIDQEINALPPKMKEVFILSRKNHLSHKEISDKLEISEHTVKNHIKAALKVLRSRLDIAVLLFLLRHY
jgi:RNA polymerase sigma-70 factor (ECF subfamily)